MSDENEDDSEIIALKRKRGPTAHHPIWTYFSDSDDGKSSFCNFCATTLKGKYSTNAINHLQKKHPDKMLEYNEQKLTYEQAMQLANSSQVRSITNDIVEDSRRNQPICSAQQLRQLAKFIASTSVPFCIVDSSEFQEFCKTLLPHFSVPAKKAVIREIRSIYLEMNQEISASITEARKISLCVDEWTKKGMTMSIVAISAHFYSRKMRQLLRVLLALRRISHPRTSDRLRQLVDEVLREWNICPDKVLRIITDNAKNMVKAFQFLSFDNDYYCDITDKLSEMIDNVHKFYVVDKNLDEELDDEAENEYVELETVERTDINYLHMPCFIHTLVLAFKKHMDDTNSEVYHAKREACQLVNYFSKSAKATERLIEISGKKLIVPSITRWNYHYHMLQRLIEQKAAVVSVCDEQGIDNIKNWRILMQLVQVLQLFADCIDLMQGQKYVTVAQCLPCLNGLLEHLQDVKTANVLPTLLCYRHNV